jgi:hypothetical protein
MRPVQTGTCVTVELDQGGVARRTRSWRLLSSNLEPESISSVSALSSLIFGENVQGQAEEGVQFITSLSPLVGTLCRYLKLR